MPKMAEDLDFEEEAAFDPREEVLRIPAEHFFCERIDLPETLDESGLDAYLEEEMQHLSPFPLEHLHWAYHHSMEDRKALLFGALSSKLRQLGWENLEVFRRVFPSFVSFLSEEFGNRHERPTVNFLMHEESLTAVAFDSNCSIPAKIFSQALTEEEINEGTVEVTRGKLLSLFDLETYEIESRILRTGFVNREKDCFKFQHLDEDFDEPLESVQLDANALWNQDIRSNAFNEEERRRRKFGHFRWTALLAAGAAIFLFALMEIGLKFLGEKVEVVQAEDLRGQQKVAEVVNLRNVLNKLEQNDRGGIDPFGSLAFIAKGRYKEDPKNPERQIPVVWFTYVKFPNRGELVIKGKGENVEAINNYLKGLLETKRVTIQSEKKKSGRDNKMDFSVDVLLKEDKSPIAKIDEQATP